MCRSRCPSAMNSVKAAWSIPGGWRLTEVRATQPKDGAVLLGLSAAVRGPEGRSDKHTDTDVCNRLRCAGIHYEFAVWLARRKARRCCEVEQCIPGDYSFRQWHYLDCTGSCCRVHAGTQTLSVTTVGPRSVSVMARHITRFGVSSCVWQVPLRVNWVG